MKIFAPLTLLLATAVFAAPAEQAAKDAVKAADKFDDKHDDKHDDHKPCKPCKQDKCKTVYHGTSQRLFGGYRLCHWGWAPKGDDGVYVTSGCNTGKIITREDCCPKPCQNTQFYQPCKCAAQPKDCGVECESTGGICTKKHGCVCPKHHISLKGKCVRKHRCDEHKDDKKHESDKSGCEDDRKHTDKSGCEDDRKHTDKSGSEDDHHGSSGREGHKSGNEMY